MHKLPLFGQIVIVLPAMRFAHSFDTAVDRLQTRSLRLAGSACCQTTSGPVAGGLQHMAVLLWSWRGDRAFASLLAIWAGYSWLAALH